MTRDSTPSPRHVSGRSGLSFAGPGTADGHEGLMHHLEFADVARTGAAAVVRSCCPPHIGRGGRTSSPPLIN